MEIKNLEVVIHKAAISNIDDVRNYIISEGYPLNAQRFSERLFNFIYSLNTQPERYAICRYKRFAKRNLHCAVFETNYIIAYKIFKFKIVVHAVINGARLK